ncbi:MAG: sulfatase-like hydrolase/transferase [Proteobacteria bacterium]|nr:sulfatase-like hydrolase/transferase [Pseudomonadota bacterium]
MGPENSPVNAGFEFAYNLLEGGGTHFDSKGFLEGGMHYQEGTERIEYPDGRYSTDLYTEKLIGFLDSTKDDDRPFFAFAAYTSPHWPLQVPDEYLDLYSGRYDSGYDVLRFENTIVIFMSDNGAAGEDFYQNGSFVDYIQREYDNSDEKMGTAESFVSYGIPWAEAGSAPFKRYKGYMREGGMTAPMIIAGRGVAASSSTDCSSNASDSVQSG